MATAVEELFSQGEEHVHAALASIESYMSNPIRQCALRTMLLGLAQMDTRGDFSWSPLAREWDRLLKRLNKAKPGNKPPAQNSDLELGEQNIPRFAFLEHRPQKGMARRAAMIALLVAHRAQQLGNNQFPGHLLYKSGADACDCPRQINEFLNGDTSALGVELWTFNENPNREKPVSLKQSAEIINEPASEAGEGDLESLFTNTFRAILKVDKSELDRICKRFFDARDLKSVAKDRSYYVAYRYSTQTPEIVRTFLAVDGPELSGVGTFSFSHIYESKRNRQKRITRGLLMGFEETYYFVGSSANVLRGRDEKGRPRIDRPFGLKLIAIPETQARTSELVPAGVYMSNSLNMQPIVGRIALLHLGYKSEIGELSDDAVQAAVLNGPERVADDIREFSKFSRTDLKAGDAQEIAEHILSKINNLPLCDRERDDLNTQGIIRALHAEDGQVPGR